MEPKLPAPSSSPEMGGYRRPEMPRVPEAAPEQNQGATAERGERHEAEAQAPAAPASVAPSVPRLPVVPPTAPPPSPAPPPIADDDTPITAADEDLIEKEWVTKAKQVVQNTKSDPYQQENEVSKLQADYLKKRYGKDVKISSS